MGNFHIIGSGGCGFLRIHQMLKDSIKLNYKGGSVKYQNSYAVWNENDGLIWNSQLLSKNERLRRVAIQTSATNITHSYLPYVPDFIELNPNIKFLCLKGSREHSIKSLATSWGYRNPCFEKDRTLGIGHNRYAVNQFPDLSDSRDHFHATERYWDIYYQIADKWQTTYSDNFLIVDSPKFFSNIEYQSSVLKFFKVSIKEWLCPIDFNDWTITTSLHGGLGNNLLQMGESISFCEKYGLPEPIFGTWDLWNGGGKYPVCYNADRFLGGHKGTHQDILTTFPNLQWKGDLIANYDTKFMINDMFRFGQIDCKNQVRERLFVSSDVVKNSVSLHLRFWTLAADDHSRMPAKSRKILN